MIKILNILIIFFLVSTTITSAQIKPGIYRLDYKYKEEDKWNIMDYNTEVFKENGNVKYISLSEKGECIIYESESNWKQNNKNLIISNITDKHREKCDDEFKTSSTKTNEIYEIMVIRDNYFIGYSKEDEEILMRWVLLNKNQPNNTISSTELKKYIIQQKELRLINTAKKKSSLELLITSGKWHIEYITSKNKKRTIPNKNKDWFVFHSNGKCEIVNNNDISIEKWIFNEKRKSLYIKLEKEFQEFEIEKINDKKIILSTNMDDGIVYFGLKK